MKQNTYIHKVIFAGAGPGDPELITLKTARSLREAEVVITDRLVSDVILESWVNPKALILHAGKQRRREGSTPQHVINELLVEYALQGKKVLRLKGGDVSVFSNLLDELQALNKYGIPYEIIPGITAACGAAACAGIPLTARNHAQAVRFLTLQATTPLQRVFSTGIHRYLSELGNRIYTSPTLIIVGKVASLHDELKWMAENPSNGELYFKPVNKNKEEEVRA